MEDLHKKRRQYCLDKLNINALNCVGIGLTGCSLLIGLFALLLFVVSILPNLGSREMLQGLSIFIVPFLILVLLLVGSVFLGLLLTRAADKQQSATPYVPPVREQIKLLPPEQILLRESNARTADAQETLRPANAPTAVDPDELLHSVESCDLN